MDPLLKQLDTRTVPPTLFSEVGFCTSGNVDPRLIKLLISGGARQWNYAGDGVSHFISGKDVDEIKLEEAKDIFEIPIVSPRWILHSAAINRLLPTHGFSGEIKQLFSSVIVTTSAISGTDMKSIAAVISYYGGSFSKVLGAHCTHLITNRCFGQKYARAMEKHVTIVSSDWVFDSVKAGRLADVKKYDPGLLVSVLHDKSENTEYSRTALRSPHETGTPGVRVVSSSESALQKNSGQNSSTKVEVQPSSSQTQSQSNMPENTNKVLVKKTGTEKEDVRTGNPAVGPQTELLPNGQYVQQQYMSPLAQRPPRPPVISNPTATTTQTFNNNHKLQPAESMPARLPQQTPSARSQFQVGMRPNSIPQWTQQQQLEIIRQIQSDPQIKQQWALMDHQQRTLLIQKLAQRNREEHLRREMMIRQQQMNISCVQRQSQIPTPGCNGMHQPGSSSDHAGNMTQLHNSSTTAHMQLTQNQNLFLCHTQNQHTPPVAIHSNQEPKHLGQPAQNVQHIMPAQLMQNQEAFGIQKTQGTIVQQPGFNRATSVVQLSDSSGEERMYISQSNEQHKELSPVQSKKPILPRHPQVMGHTLDQMKQPGHDMTQSGIQLVDSVRKTEESISSQLETRPNQFFGPGSASNQGQLMFPHHQARPSIRPEQKVSSSADMIHSNRFEPQQPQPGPSTSQPKYFPPNQSSMEKQVTHSPGSGLGGSLSQACGIVRTQHIFTPQLSQQRLNVRHVLLPQGQQQHHIILQPQSSPARSPIISQKLLLPPPSPQPQTIQSTTTQWSPTQTGKIQTSLATDPSSQNWNIRSPQHQTNVVYTGNQSAMPFAQVVNSKTKTALANLLSNRLMGSTVPEPNITGNHILPRSPSPVQNLPSPVPLTQPPSIKPGVQIATSAAQQQNTALQRRTGTNSTTGIVQVINQNSGRALTGQQQPPPLSYVPARAQFFAHDPNVKLPPDGFLLGCIFWTVQPVPVKHWETIVNKYGGEVETSYCPRVSHVLCQTQKFPEFQQCIRDGKRLVTAEWLSDVCSRKCVTTPFYATHLPVPFSPSEKPLLGEYFSTTGFLGEDRERVKMMCSYLGAKVTSVFTRAHTGLIALKASGTKFEKAREWKKPVVNVQFLNELMFGHIAAAQLIHSPKYQQFNIDQPFRFDIAMVAPLLASWKVPIRVNTDAFEKYTSRKFGSGHLEGAEPPAKRQKLHIVKNFDELFPVAPEVTPCPQSSEYSNEVKPVVIFSGLSHAMKELLQSKVEHLKGRVTNDMKEATHLVIKEQCLTKKLFLGISRLSAVVPITWLRDSVAQGRFLDTAPYALELESCKSGISYNRILKSPNRHTLLSDLTFFVTPSIPIYHSDLVEIITAAGGHIDKQSSLKRVLGLACESPSTYMIVSCVEDEYLTRNWKNRNGKELVLLNRDTILEWILRQEIRLSALP